MLIEQNKSVITGLDKEAKRQIFEKIKRNLEDERKFK